MFLNKIFHFVKGYVIIRVYGIGIERFLYICAKRGISLFYMGEMTDDGIDVCIHISDFKSLRPIVRKAGARIRIVKKCGLPFYIKKYKKRYVLLAGFFLLFVFVFFSSFFIWSVQIDSGGATVPEGLEEALEKTGVKIGAFKPSLSGGDDIKNIIIDNTDNIVWAWVYIKGTRAVLEYREGTPAPALVDKSVACDIVARRDGLVMCITEKNGNAIVKKGHTVLSADVLIEGVSASKEDKGIPVHAIGEVRAYTWHEKSRDYSLVEKKSTPTGRKKSYYTLKLFSKCINLYRREKIEFETYRIDEFCHELKLGEDNYLGIGIYKKDYVETVEETMEADYDEVLEYAKNQLEEEIAKELFCASRLVDKKLTHEKTDEKTVRVTLTMEFIENIGKEIIN